MFTIHLIHSVISDKLLYIHFITAMDFEGVSKVEMVDLASHSEILPLLIVMV